jgi:hypothetical protein
MPITVIRKTYLPRGNLLLRLNASDTKFLLRRIQDAIEKGAGANLIFFGVRAAICEIDTPEHSREISINAYSNEMTFRVESDQKGYTGEWSHAEIVMPLAAIRGLSEFVEGGNHGH